MCFRYEKMQTGEHIGEQVRLVLQKMKEQELLFQDHWPTELDVRGRFYTKYISEILRSKVYFLFSLGRCCSAV